MPRLQCAGPTCVDINLNVLYDNLSRTRCRRVAVDIGRDVDDSSSSSDDDGEQQDDAPNDNDGNQPLRKRSTSYALDEITEAAKRDAGTRKTRNSK